MQTSNVVLTPFTANPLTTPSNSPVLAQVSNLPTTASTQPGLVLSPAAEPLPRRLVEKIVSGQFAEMPTLEGLNAGGLPSLEGPNAGGKVKMLEVYIACYNFL